MKAALKRALFWLSANALGICSYLLLETWILAPRPEEEAFNGIDEAYFWFTKEFPLLIGFFVFNLIWLIRVITDGLSNGKWRSLAIWLVVCLAWGSAVKAYGLGIHVVKLWVFSRIFSASLP